MYNDHFTRRKCILSGSDKVQQKRLSFHQVLCIKASFNFKQSIEKCSIADTWCTGYPMTTKRLWTCPYQAFFLLLLLPLYFFLSFLFLFLFFCLFFFFFLNWFLIIILKSWPFYMFRLQLCHLNLRKNKHFIGLNAHQIYYLDKLHGLCKSFSRSINRVSSSYCTGVNFVTITIIAHWHVKM